MVIIVTRNFTGKGMTGVWRVFSSRESAVAALEKEYPGGEMKYGNTYIYAPMYFVIEERKIY